MYHNTWETNGLKVTIGAPPAVTSKCMAYAFFGDKGCRTWESKCTVGKWPEKPCPGKASCPTLHKRANLTTDEFTLIGRPSDGSFCTETADFSDGPNDTPTDAACKQHCLKGDKTNPVPNGGEVSVSAQASDDKSEVVIRIANPKPVASSVTIKLIDGDHADARAGGSAVRWSLKSTDPMGANMPSNPISISPVKVTSLPCVLCCAASVCIADPCGTIETIIRACLLESQTTVADLSEPVTLAPNEVVVLVVGTKPPRLVPFR